MNNNAGCFSQGAHILGWIIVIFIVMTLPAAIIMRTASDVFFEPQLIAQGLSDGILDSGALRDTVTQQLLASTAGEQEDEILLQMTSELTAAEWRRISEIALPDQWLEEQVEDLTNGLFQWLNGAQLEPELVVNVEPVKRRLIGEGSSQIVEIIVNSWPECTALQAQEFEEAFRQGAPLPLMNCRLPEPLNSVIVARITEEFQQQARSIPTELELLDLEAEEAGRLLPIKSQLRQLRFIARWAILIPLAMMGFLMALVVRSLRDWTRWWGVPLLIGGVLTVFLSLLLMTVQPEWAADLSMTMELPDLLVNSLASVLIDLGDQVVWRSALWGMGLGAVGAMLLAASLVLPDGGDNSIKLSGRAGLG